MSVWEEPWLASQGLRCLKSVHEYYRLLRSFVPQSFRHFGRISLNVAILFILLIGKLGDLIIVSSFAIALLLVKGHFEQ
jgi:hypothetical protein